MVQNMARLGQSFLLLICAQFVLPARIENMCSTYENASGPSYSRNIRDQLPIFYEPSQCEKSENEVHLKFSNAGFRRLSEHFINSSLVTCLSLDNNGITEISPAAFDLLSRLHFLDLSGNNIYQEMFFSLNRNENLKTLVLDNVFTFFNHQTFPYTEVETFPFPNLKSLFLRGNGIDSVALQTSLSKLTHLYLSENALWKDQNLNHIKLPPSVTHLSLDGNSIERLEIDHYTMQNLVFINLNNNKFTHMCYSYCQSSFLYIVSLPKLQYFLLSGNQIGAIDEDAFHGTPQLFHLDLSHNKIESFEENTFSKLVYLRNFIANDNRLKTVPLFSANPNLKKINLSNNQIQTIKNDAFSKVLSLEYLDLSGNGISYLPENWTLLRMKLRVLLLKDNLFANFENFHLTKTTSLTDLYIEGNLITHFNRVMLKDMPMDVSVHFQNPKSKSDFKYFCDVCCNNHNMSSKM